MPKSVSLAVPSAVTRMFDGFTSRCTMPASCAAVSASATWARRRAASPGRRPPPSVDELGEVGADHVLHDQPLLLALADEVEDGHDVRVVEPGRESRLALGAHQPWRVPAGEEPDALERDLAPEQLVAGQPDGAHPALADLVQQDVAAPDDGVRLAHRTPPSRSRRVARTTLQGGSRAEGTRRVPQARVELATFRLGGGCSIH